VKTLGSIKDIHNLALDCTHDSRDFHRFQAVAEAVNSADSLRKLRVYLDGEIFPRDPSGLTTFADAPVREHTGLQEFNLMDYSPLLEAEQSTPLDTFLRTLSASHLRKVFIETKYASADAIRNLLQLSTVTALRLVLPRDQWLAVAEEIRMGRCLIKDLADRYGCIVMSTIFFAEDLLHFGEATIRWEVCRCSSRLQ
jgi:hypothetical protein